MINPEIQNSMINNFDSQEAVSFRIEEENIGKIMGILTGDIYKNKPGAVVRELSTNCLDAHKLNRNPDPFVIILPTVHNNNILTIRDFGPGLSDADMLDLYTSYAKSTKDKTNDFTGCLGLGSKSPLSLSPNFTVTSYYNNAETTYNIFMENGIPKLIPINKMELVPISNDDVITLDRDKGFLFKHNYEEYTWYKNFLIGKMTYDHTFTFGIKLREYLNGLFIETDGQNAGYINNEIILNMHLKKEGDEKTDSGLVRMFSEILTFKDRPKGEEPFNDINQRLLIIGKTGVEIPVENIDYDQLNSYEKNYHNDGFSFFKIDLTQLTEELNHSGYFIEAKQLVLSGEELEESNYNKDYAQLIDDIYDTTFKTGLRIDIPISAQYRSQIAEEVKKQLMFFSVMPRVVEIGANGPKKLESFSFESIKKEGVAFEVAPDIFLIKNNNLRPTSWSRSASPEYYNSIGALDNLFTRAGGCRLVQGDVNYPVELEMVLSTVKSTSRDPRFKIDRSDFEAFEHYLKHLSNSMVIFFDIGEISFQPSREGLNYDAATSIKIYDKVRMVLTAYKEELQNFISEAKDELDFQMRLLHVKQSATTLSLFNQFNSNSSYLTAVAKSLNDVVIGEEVYSVKTNRTVQALYELFKPVSAINDMLKTKSKLDKPCLWEVNRKTGNNTFVPNNISSITNNVVPPIFIVVDGKKYRKVIYDHIRDIINNIFEQQRKNGMVDVLDDKGNVTHTKPTAMWYSKFKENLILDDKVWYDVSKSVYLIFEEYLNIPVLEGMSTEEYISKHLNLSNNIPGVPRVLNYKAELKKLIDSGKISKPTKEKRTAFLGLGYKFNYGRMNPEGRLHTKERKETQPDGTEKIISETSRVSTRAFEHYFGLIKSRNIDADAEFHVDADEVDDFLERVENNDVLIVPYDNKTKSLVAPFLDYNDEYFYTDTEKHYKMNIFQHISKSFIHSDNYKYYFWYLFMAGVITNETEIVFAKMNVLTKLGLNKYSIWDEERMMSHLESITTTLKDKRLILINDSSLNNFHFGYSTYSGMDRIFNEKEFAWKSTFLKNPILTNDFKNTKLVVEDRKKIIGKPVPQFLMDFHIRKESVKQLFQNESNSNSANYHLRDNLNIRYAVGTFHDLYYNYQLLKNSSLLVSQIFVSELNPENKDSQKGIERTPDKLRTKILNLLRDSSQPHFSIYLIRSERLPDYKYLLLNEFNELHHKVTTQRCDSNDIKAYNKIHSNFVALNHKALENLDSVIENLLTVEGYYRENALRSSDIVFTERTMDLVINIPSVSSAYTSEAKRQKIIRSKIIFNKKYKREIKRLEDTLSFNARLDMQKIENALRTEKILEMYKKNLRPIRFTSPLKIESTNNLESHLNYAWTKFKPFSKAS